MENEISIAHLEQSVLEEKSVVKPKTRVKARVKKLLKALLIVSLALTMLLFAARLVWRFSGSNQWELVRDEKGVKIYTLKSPGSDLIKVKGIGRFRTTMAAVVKFMTDPATCEYYNCYDSHVIERVDDHLLYSTARYRYPYPFKPREIVMRTQIHQNPQTKEVLMVNTSVPDKAPLSDCCFRVAEMNNTIRLTPLGNGEVEVEYIQNMNEGGYVPDLLLNTNRPAIFYMIFRNFQKLLDKEKFQNVKLSYIEEK
jgi:hypothetical protein